MLSAMSSAGATKRDVNIVLGSSPSGGGMASHYFGETGQFEIPTREMYNKLRARWPHAFDRDYDDLRFEYDYRYREFEAARDEIRRPFAVSKNVPYTDVWTYPTVPTYAGKHSCEKPWQMGLDIVRASSRPGDLVLDCFSGSGCFPAAAVALGRRAIACDMNPEWANVTRERCQRALDNADAASSNRSAPVRVAS
jgi:adenine-specific DNA-methyltransferase